jgi:hypothetical protein
MTQSKAIQSKEAGLTITILCAYYPLNQKKDRNELSNSAKSCL